MEFLESDFSSPTWIRLKQFYEARLITLRSKNDHQLSPEETARLRGRIFEIKCILALPEKAPPQEANDALS